jgi:predicted transposase/invertase (TIGR01784 family)
LTDKEIESIVSSLTLKVILYTFKEIRELGNLDKLDRLIELSRDLFDTSSGLKVIEKLLLYLYLVQETPPDKVKKRIEHIVAERTGDIAMTTAEKLREEGLKQGKLEDARRMKEKGYPIEDISEITGLSLEEIEEI